MRSHTNNSRGDVRVQHFNSALPRPCIYPIYLSSVYFQFFNNIMIFPPIAFLIESSPIPSYGHSDPSVRRHNRLLFRERHPRLAIISSDKRKKGVCQRPRSRWSLTAENQILIYIAFPQYPFLLKIQFNMNLE